MKVIHWDSKTSKTTYQLFDTEQVNLSVLFPPL